MLVYSVDISCWPVHRCYTIFGQVVNGHYRHPGSTESSAKHKACHNWLAGMPMQSHESPVSIKHDYIFYHFLSFIKIEMMQVVQILHHGRQGLVNPVYSILFPVSHSATQHTVALATMTLTYFSRIIPISYYCHEWTRYIITHVSLRSCSPPNNPAPGKIFLKLCSNESMSWFYFEPVLVLLPSFC